MTTKICSKCKTKLSITEFYKDKTTLDGLHYWCKKCINTRWKKYYIKNRIKILNHAKENIDKIRITAKKWREKNKLKLRKKKRIYEYNRRRNDINFRLMKCLRSRVSAGLKGFDKSKNTIKLIGCTIKQLKKHLTSKFTKGMTWDNYGKWEIDHIRPCANFDLSKPEEQRKCFHYLNLQPLWMQDNRRKNDKFTYTFNSY